MAIVFKQRLGKKMVEKCSGASPHFQRLLAKSLGHTLLAGQIECAIEFMFCGVCGTWGTRTTSRLMAQPCARRKSKKGQEALSRIAAG